ncbi:uncharacterized protein BDR25DRAFT_334636 [Lindgomyces ingoldianus]|uniref:Uncharacterized protein n=1 Tax=Lindgomyces ingoldianus TaxID=673940 RepID=A0ACB6QTF6_9PLEO|nr:uncharacterized protein BDR25DRAFT_334636 [Lindgomyces ingoldianus]KAF2470156.1 hypothetical protein BDR25DRAFT_334636 [Lindgomyces ingoldianus]
MADEEKEKAEKVAAAKKRYEQLKKQKAKKAGGAKKKEEKAEATEAEASTTAAPEKSEERTEELAPEPVEATSASPGPIEDDDEPAELPKATQGHGRKPSVAVESRLRSASFYQGGSGGTPTSPTAITPGGDVSGDIYRKQAQRIEELERENKRLVGEVDEGERRWKKGEEELEELREGRGDVALAVERGREVDKLKSEVESLKRQLSHLQTQSSKSSRRISTSSPSQSSSIDDLNAQVASKSTTIESLELEISNLHKQVTDQTNKTSTLQTQVSTLESSLQKAEQEASSTKTELSELKANLERASERAVKEGSSRSSAETRIAQLEAELGAANRKASDSISRAELLEKKVETLTQLHRDNDARNQTRVQEHKKVEREAAELRTRVTGLNNENARLREAEQRRRKADISSIDDSGVQELVDEERERLLAKVRELEEENFELRRGVWRDRRRDMQPSIEDHVSPSQSYASPGFDEVDLSGGHHHSPSRNAPRTGSTLQDVINSGISAFTGQPLPHRRSDAGSQPGKGSVGRERLQSLGSLDDFEFDEEAFRAAQEEENRKRIERVREVKRGLKDFVGWRGDFVDVRAGWGGVFEV